MTSARHGTRSATAAADDDHILVVFEHHFVRLVQVEHGDGTELRGHAAGTGHRLGVHRVHQSLHNGVVGGVHVFGQREATLAVTVEGVVPHGGHNPVVPAHVAKVHVQATSLTLVLLVALAVAARPLLVPRPPLAARLDRVAAATVVVGIRDEQRLCPSPDLSVHVG